MSNSGVPCVPVVVAAVLLVAALTGAVVLRYWVEQRARARAGLDEGMLAKLHPGDQRVRRDVEAALVRRLRSGVDADVARRYGRFSHLSGVTIGRPRRAFGSNNELNFEATAHFATASAPVSLHVTSGPTFRISRLHMDPTEQYVRDNPSHGGGLTVIDGELRTATPGGMRSRLWGQVEHPDYVHYVRR